MMNVLIIGGGKVGSHLAALLLAGGHKVRLIEQRAEVARRLSHGLPKEVVLAGNGTDPVLLESAGIRQTQVVAAVTGWRALSSTHCARSRVSTTPKTPGCSPPLWVSMWPSTRPT
jgi:trk system potassium uptake protein TrkA